jgi:hypothetical protein
VRSVIAETVNCGNGLINRQLRQRPCSGGPSTWGSGGPPVVEHDSAVTPYDRGNPCIAVRAWPIEPSGVLVQSNRSKLKYIERT